MRYCDDFHLFLTGFRILKLVLLAVKQSQDGTFRVSDRGILVVGILQSN